MKRRIIYLTLLAILACIVFLLFKLDRRVKGELLLDETNLTIPDYVKYTNYHGYILVSDSLAGSWRFDSLTFSDLKTAIENTPYFNDSLGLLEILNDSQKKERKGLWFKRSYGYEFIGMYNNDIIDVSIDENTMTLKFSSR